MAENAAPVTKPAAPPRQRAPQLPPDEQFWRRYSPRQEIPISTLVSIFIHIVALVVLTKLVLDTLDRDPIEVQPIAFAEGGGGGNPGSAGVGPGTTTPEEAVNNPADTKVPPYIGPKLNELPPVKVDPAQFVEFSDDPETKRLIEKGTQALPALSKLQQNARQRLMEGLVVGQGDTGKGADGGKDAGRDKGEGPSKGSGKGASDVRKKRVLRWTMIFDTRDGADYLRQLSALGAILGVPQKNGYLIVRNLLEKPAQGAVEDLNKINRIFWVDDRAESIQALAQALELEPVPDHIVAFFPQSLEADLLKKEYQYHKKPEHLVQETRFRVIRRGNSYEAVVVDGR